MSKVTKRLATEDGQNEIAEAIREITRGVLDIERAEQAAEAAENSADAAAASATAADTVATALTDIYNDAIDQGTIVAPAVDKTLSISGAAADAQITGQSFGDINSDVVAATSDNALSGDGLSSVTVSALEITPVISGESFGILVDGTCSANYDYYLIGTVSTYVDVFEVGKTYKFTDHGTNEVYLFVVKKDADDNVTYYNTIGSGNVFTKNEGDTFRVFVRVLSGFSGSIMLRPVCQKTFLSNYLITEKLNTKAEKAYRYTSISATTSEGVMSVTGSVLTAVGNHAEISVNYGDVYKVTGYNSNASYPLYLFLNGSVVVDYYHETLEKVEKDVYVRIPEGCNKLVVNYITVYDIKKGIDDEYIPFDVSNEYLELDYYTGALSVSNVVGANGHRALMSVKEGEVYYISGKKWYSATPANVCPGWLMFSGPYTLVYYQGDGTLPDPDFFGDYYFTDYEITIPAGITVLVINGNAISGIRAKTGTMLPYEHKYKKLEGKTAVFFGTSIPQNEVFFEGNNWSIPSYACEKLLGMKCINECVGASIAARGNGDIITDSDPYGWTGVSWYAVFRSLGSNLTEKEDLIDNYNSKWKALLGGSDDPLYTDAKPASIDSDMADYIRSCSYENRLVPYLDGTYDMPDLFVFEHGWNDSYFDAHMSELPANDNDLQRSSYMGAMTFFVRLIFEANPQAKILIMSHYDNSSDRGKRVFAAQKEFSVYEGVYFCDIANNIGWTQRHVTTTGYWNNGYWVASGGASRTITRKAQCIPDELHPHLDKSGNAVKREAQILADFINSNINLD